MIASSDDDDDVDENRTVDIFGKDLVVGVAKNAKDLDPLLRMAMVWKESMEIDTFIVDGNVF